MGMDRAEAANGLLGRAKESDDDDGMELLLLGEAEVPFAVDVCENVLVEDDVSATAAVGASDVAGTASGAP